MSIKAGDLVMAVRGHFCDVGDTFIVSDVRESPLGWVCRQCELWEKVGVIVAVRPGRRERIYPLSWLIKIDPPSIPEFTNDKEELSV